MVKVWLPTEPTNGPASKEFVYTPGDRPAWIKHRQLNHAATGSYLESWGYFDGFGRNLQTQAPLLDGSRTVTSQACNNMGQAAYASSPYAASGPAGSGYITPTWTSLANYTYTTYDELGRGLRTETRSGANQLWATHSAYDGWLASSYDANDHRQDAVADAFGQIVQVLEYNSDGTYTTNYAYDLAGRLTGVTDAANNVTTIGYDLLGRKTGMSDPDMGSWQYGYDSAGNLTSQRDGASRWLYLEYDALNRLIRKRQDSVSGPLLAEWQYDATGQVGLLSKSLAYSGAGTTEVYNVAYDALNRLTQQQYTVPGTGGGVFRFDRSYNTAGQALTLRYPGGNAGQQGEVVTYGYNAIGQLNSLTSDDGTQYIAATSYNAQGQMTEQQLDAGANGFTRQYGYNPSTLRLDTLKAGKATPFEELQKLSYTYDLAGNITGIADATNTNQTQTFGYDWLDRLTSAATSAVGVGQYSHTYAYNAIGNLTSYNGNVYTYGSQPHAVTGAFGNSYGYDANGSQTSRIIAGTPYTQTFDYDNRLVGVAGGSVSATFVYDADGNRVKGIVAGVTTVYIAGLYEWQNGAVTKYYEGGVLRRTGYVVDNGVFYVVSDQVKSTSVLVNQDGTVNSRNYYYPYGGNRGGSAFSGITTKRFTGQYHEQGLPGGEGLSYYGARWYDSQVGVFVTADTLVPSPLAPQTLNRFAYVGGNPLRFVDPSGHVQCRTQEECLDMGTTPGWGSGSSNGGSSNGGSSGGGGSTGGGGTSSGNSGWYGPTGGGGSGGGGNTVGGGVGIGLSGGGGGTNPPNLNLDKLIIVSRYSNETATAEAWSEVSSWFHEVGPEVRVFGPQSSLTIDVANDPQLQAVRKVWTSGGYPMNVAYQTTIDNREGGLTAFIDSAFVYFREHLVQLGLSTIGLGSPWAAGQIDAVGGTIGSFDSVIITQAAPGFARFEVRNTMGMASAFRIPGSNGGFGRDVPRSQTSFCCGTITQVFWWWEPIPFDQ